MLKSTVFDWNKITPEPTPVGARRPFFDDRTGTLDRMAFHCTILNPGQTPHPPHRHPDEEMMIVKEGALEVVINGKTTIATPGCVTFITPNDLHGWKNVGTVPAIYFVMRFWTAATAKEENGQ